MIEILKNSKKRCLELSDISDAPHNNIATKKHGFSSLSFDSHLIPSGISATTNHCYDIVN